MTSFIRTLRAAALIASAPLSISMATAAITPAGLRTEHGENPLGIDTQRPRLSWRMEADRPGAMQSAYQIEVAGMWDSGKVKTDRSIAIPYAGAALESGKTYHWRVRVWDENGEPSPWSEPARWTMGKLRERDWSAEWIGPAAGPGGVDLDGVELKRAIYRTLDGAVQKDVTEVMGRVIAENRLPFLVDFNALGGDPAPYVVKELVVDYTKHGTTMVSRARDFTLLSIPQGPVGTPAPWFRGELVLADKPESALVTVHSAAYFELYVNGRKAGDDVLTPLVTNPKVRTHIVTYDVAHLLTPGRNCIGLWVAKGWADSIAIRAQLDAVVDGKKVTFGTDSSWKTRNSDRSHIGSWTWGDFGGERVDAAAYLPDWATAGLDTAGWSKVSQATAPAGQPVNHSFPLNRIGAKIPAREIIALADGRYEIDFGTNLTGWLELKLPQLKAGQTIRLHFADRVFPDGKHSSPIGDISIHHGSCIGFKRADGGNNLYQCFKQTSEFVSAGVPGEVFSHKFNYAGFRHVVIEGLPGAPDLDDVTAMLVETDLDLIGSFECSDERINRIHKVNAWTIRSLNLGGYPVDCPHRERMGYGDGQVFMEGMMMGFGAARFYEKWLADWRDTQDPANGGMPFIAPSFLPTGGGPPWPGVIGDGPWQHYLHYGDIRVLEENIEAARRYIEYLDSRSTDDVLRSWGEGLSFIGDWVPPGRGMDTSNWPSREMAEFFCNVYRVRLWQWVGQMAGALGRMDLADHAESRMDAIRKATHAAYYDASNKRYVIDEQIYYAFPLYMGVVPESERAAVLANLKTCLIGKNRGHLDTGMIGTKYLIKFLDEAGLDEMILPFYQSPDYPGWGYMVENGATTFWEQWNGHWSQIHSCFASADNWLYHGLAGIRPDPGKPGFKNVIIEPAATRGVTWVKAHHDGPYGRIAVNWTRKDDRLVIEVEIPPNSTATVRIPDGGTRHVGPGRHRFEGE